MEESPLTQAASFASLPTEILSRISQNLLDIPAAWGERHGLKNLKILRLTCRRLAVLTTKILFHTVVLYPLQTSYESLYSIQSSPLSRHVRELSLHTISTASDGKKTFAFHVCNDHGGGPISSDNESHEMSLRWYEAVKSISKFPNLKSLRLKFSNECSDESEMYLWVDETIRMRNKVLKAVFAALNSKTHPIPNLRSLTIQNLQDLNNPARTDSPDFKEVLSKLQELNLHIATDYEEACPENSISHETLHTFFRELHSVWLQPVSQSLTQLTLYCDTYWGYAPPFDPRGLRFPNLRYLALGNYVFGNDWQLDWITSLGSTLQTLILDDCPIVFYIWPCDSLRSNTSTLRHDDHTILLKGEDDVDSETDDDQYLYGARWHHYFPKLEQHLPNLVKFVMGSGNWPEKCFDERDRLLPRLDRKRYVAFNGGIGPSQWCETWDRLDCPVEEVDVTTPALREPPCLLLDEEGKVLASEKRHVGAGGCQKQDVEAFEKLLRTVNRRARQMGLDDWQIISIQS